MTGTVLADVLARTETEQLVLAGHSLGARVMARAAETLSLKAGPARLKSVHLVGAALGADGDWRRLNDSVSSRAVAYISKNDQVLNQMCPARAVRITGPRQSKVADPPSPGSSTLTSARR